MYRISVEPMATYGVSERLQTEFHSLEHAKAMAERLYAFKVAGRAVYRTVAVMEGKRMFACFDGEWSR